MAAQLDPDVRRALRETSRDWADPTRRAFPHVQAGGAYWCNVTCTVYAAVLLEEDTGRYRCRACGAEVVVPTCGGEGE